MIFWYFSSAGTRFYRNNFICTRRLQMSPIHSYCRREDTFRWAEVAAAASHMIERFARCGKSDLCTHNQFKMLKNFPTSWLVNLRSLAELSKSISIWIRAPAISRIRSSTAPHYAPEDYLHWHARNWSQLIELTAKITNIIKFLVYSFFSETKGTGVAGELEIN